MQLLFARQEDRPYAHPLHPSAYWLTDLTGVLTGTESAKKLGKFLVMSQFQGSVHSSALFLTAAAQNLLCLKLATEMGVVISSPWVTWVKGALAPALVGMLVTPLLMYKVRHFPLSPCCTHLPPLVGCLFFSWVILRGLLTLTCL